MLEQLQNIYPSASVDLRCDFNVGINNVKRKYLLTSFMNAGNLTEVAIDHPTYHHFMGNGISDSYLDRLLFSKKQDTSEFLHQIHCRDIEPMIDSHHDMILFIWSLSLE